MHLEGIHAQALTDTTHDHLLLMIVCGVSEGLCMNALIRDLFAPRSPNFRLLLQEKGARLKSRVTCCLINASNSVTLPLLGC